MSDETCELENSNLRRCLAWAGQHLTIEQRRELIQMIKQPLEQGGVTQGDMEAGWENAKKWQKVFVKAAALLRQVTNVSSMKQLDRTNWFAQAEQTANLLMEFDPPEPDTSLAVITNAEEVGG